MGASSVVRVTCCECKKDFVYRKRSNVTRKYCDKCAASRTKASKLRSLQIQREERQHEKSASSRLALIPDFPFRPAWLLDQVAKTAR